MVRENNEEATNLLFEKYKPIVLKIAKEYYTLGKKCGLDLDDFIQEGYYALYLALKKYSDRMNTIFYTYAIICIKSKMQNLLVRNSTNKHQALNYSISFYEKIEDKSLLDYLKDDKAIDPTEAIESIEFEKEVKRVLYTIKFEDSIICELKLNGFSNKDTATLLDITPSNVYKAFTQFKKNLMIVVEKSFF